MLLNRSYVSDTMRFTPSMIGNTFYFTLDKLGYRTNRAKKRIGDYARFPTQLLLAPWQLSALYFAASAAAGPKVPTNVDPPGSMLRVNDPESVVESEEGAPRASILQ